jgi:hypothetical protein
MKTALLATTLLTLLSTWLPAAAATDEVNLLRMSACQDSWLAWKDDNARMGRFVSALDQQFTRKDEDGSFAPKASMNLLGFPVAQVYPQSVGMGVGFSVVVNAPFAQVRQAFEKQLGKPMKCEASEGTRACELPLGEKKTAMLMASESPASKVTLLGCYYYYEK